MILQCIAFNSIFSNDQHPARLVVRDTAHWAEKKGSESLAADLSLFSSDAKGHALSKDGQEKSQAAAARRPWMSRMLWGIVRAFIEVKVNVRLKKTFSGSVSEATRLVRGQLVKYVAQIMLRQHRTGIFSIFIYRNIAYLMYWEPSGVAISEPIDYVEEPIKLFTFIFRLGQMTDAQLGYDPAVQLAEETAEEVKAMRAFKSTVEYHRRYLTEALSPGWSVYRVTVKDAEGKVLVLLIGRHRHASRSAFGRLTRGFVAYDPVGKRLVFFKTYWRPDTEGALSESEIYMHMHKEKVDYIATWIGGGDVCYPVGHPLAGTSQRTKVSGTSEASYSPLRCRQRGWPTT